MLFRDPKENCQISHALSVTHPPAHGARCMAFGSAGPPHGIACNLEFVCIGLFVMVCLHRMGCEFGCISELLFWLHAFLLLYFNKHVVVEQAPKEACET